MKRKDKLEGLKKLDVINIRRLYLWSLSVNKSVLIFGH
jgi:hypothetical protein